MAAWSSLPPEIKRHVVTKLDFMSRHSLRCTSRLDREIVDSTIRKLPRVRFGYKEDKCLIVIYTGIDKFLRWELTKCENEVMYERFENSLDPKLANRKTIIGANRARKHLPHLHCAILLLYYLLAHPSIKIQTLECEAPNIGDTEEEHMKTVAVIWDILEDKPTKFRVKQLEFAVQNHPLFSRFVKKYVYPDDLKPDCIVGILVRKENSVPLVAHKIVMKTNEENYNAMSFVMIKNPRHTYMLHDTNMDQLKMEENLNQPKLFSYCDPTKKFHKEKVERKVHGDIVDIIVSTKCGMVVHTVHSSFETEFQEYFEPNKCGIGSLCKNCADPFDYWYTRNFPSRVYYESFWNGTLGTEQINLESEIRGLSKKFEKLEKEKMKKGNVQKQEEVPSWGFKTGETSEPIVMDFGNDDSIFTVSDLKYFTIFLILPIFVSIVCYFFLMDSKFNFKFFK